MFCSEEDRALAKTSDWINGTASAVGHVLRPRRSSEDEREPLMSRQSIDEEMGLGMVFPPTQPAHGVVLINLSDKAPPLAHAVPHGWASLYNVWLFSSCQKI